MVEDYGNLTKIV